MTYGGAHGEFAPVRVSSHTLICSGVKVTLPGPRYMNQERCRPTFLPTVILDGGSMARFGRCELSGAGGGGFLMLYCEEKRPQVREAMRAAGLRELKFRFDFEGSKVVFDAVSRDGRLAHNRRHNNHENGALLAVKALG